MQEIYNAIDLARKSDLSDDDILYIIGFSAGSRRKISDREFVFSSPIPEIHGDFLKISLNRKMKISTVLLLNEKLRTKATELVETICYEATRPDTFIMSRVMFSLFELKGTFLWADTVRLRPILSKINIGSGLCWYSSVSRSITQDENHLGPPFPFVLEVKVRGGQNSPLSMRRGLLALDQFGWIVSTLVCGVFNHEILSKMRQWVAVSKDPEFAIEYHLVHSGISWNESSNSTDFLACDDIDVDYYDGPDYYNALLAQEKKLLFPKNLYDLLDIASTLAFKERANFVRACYFFSLAERRQWEQQDPIVELASAIECLLPKSTQKRCECCGADTNSIRSRFNAFLKNHVPVDINIESLRKRFYEKRSEAVHGSTVNTADYGWLSPIYRDETTSLIAYFHTRRAIVGWLASQSETKPDSDL